MNRIYELAKEADEYADATLSPGEFHPDWHDVRDEKFAKLIVQECIENIHDINEDFNHGNVFINNKKLWESVTSDYAIYTNELAESIIKRFIEFLQQDAEPEDFVDGKLWVDDDLIKSTVNEFIYIKQRCFHPGKMSDYYEKVLKKHFGVM